MKTVIFAALVVALLGPYAVAQITGHPLVHIEDWNGVTCASDTQVPTIRLYRLRDEVDVRCE